MHVIDDVRHLKDHLDQIVTLPRNGQLQVTESGIIDAASAARRLLESIEKVNFKKYNHTLMTNIRAIRLDPDDSADGEVIYEREKRFSLKKLCSAIVHLRSFTFNYRADGKHWIEAINDRNERYRVFYSDFISELRCLVLSKRLVVLALCDLAEKEVARAGRNFPQDNDPMSFPSMSLDWLLHQHLVEEDQLKLDILKEIFGIRSVPPEVLHDLRFARNTDESGRQMTIEFDPPWEDGQVVVSPSFSQAKLFSLIRDFYKDRNNPRRVFN